METFLAIVALLFVLSAVVGTVAVAKVARATRRGLDRTLSQARRSVEDSTLRARRLSRPGVLGDLADLRWNLRTSMRATQDALREGAARDASLSEALGLFERLSDHGWALEEELRRLEREPDRGQVVQRLPELRRRTERVVSSADSLRWAARDRARNFAADDLDHLGAQIDIEAGALRDWAERGQDARETGEAPAAAATDTSRKASGDGSRAGSARSGEGAEALTARAPHTAVPGWSTPWTRAGRAHRAR